MPERATNVRLGATTAYRVRCVRPRASSSQRGYDYRWQKARLAFLADHPLCEGECADAGRVTEAVDVHHVDGLGPKGPRGFDETNLVALCHSCHSKVTRSEQLDG
jgi:5-methylcytosine-specific restriction protein A